MAPVHQWTAASIVAASLSLSTIAPAQPSFPGAQGFGALATGGRGGKVIKVTSLAEDGPGTLRAALETSGSRIVVFDVSGVIDLGPPNSGDPFDESPSSNVIVIRSGNVTIAGQTAPGGGITLRGRLYADYDSAVQNIILRHVRIRPAPFSGGSGGDQYDVLRFSVNARVMIDHVSVSWGVDECVDLYQAADITMQWSIIGEGSTTGHPEGEHNYGLLNDAGPVSVHHTLFVHNKNRNPALAIGDAESFNNVAYNVRHGFVHHNEALGSFNIAGNYFRRGPSDVLIPFFFDGEPFTNVGYYLHDNYVDDPGQFVGSVDNPWDEPSYFQDLSAPSSLYRATPFDFSSPGYVAATVEASTSAWTSVITKAGAWPRDVVDERFVQETTDRTGSWGAHIPADLFTGLTAEAPQQDTDGDGMPDDWETGHALDPNDPSDTNTILGSGYTAIEEYINERADALIGQGGTGGGGGAGGSGGTEGVGGSGGFGGAANVGGSGGVAQGGAGGGGSGGAAIGGVGGLDASVEGTGGTGANAIVPGVDKPSSCACSAPGSSSKRAHWSLIALAGLTFAARILRGRSRRSVYDAR